MKNNTNIYPILIFSLVLASCGGTGGAYPTDNSTTISPPLTTASGVVVNPVQSFSTRLTKTPYPTKSLVDDPEAMVRILGVDADKNGIRDDVDQLISTLSTDPMEIKAYQQYARVAQQDLSVKTQAEAYAQSAKSVRALKCFRKIGTDDLKSYKDGLKLNIIIKKTINTLERVIRSDEVDTLSHGVVISFDPNEDLSNVCD